MLQLLNRIKICFYLCVSCDNHVKGNVLTFFKKLQLLNRIKICFYRWVSREKFLKTRSHVIFFSWTILVLLGETSMLQEATFRVGCILWLHIHPSSYKLAIMTIKLCNITFKAAYHNCLSTQCPLKLTTMFAKVHNIISKLSTMIDEYSNIVPSCPTNTFWHRR